MNRPSYLLFKKCTKCGKILHISKFCKNKEGRYGVRPDCKECHNKRSKKIYKENKNNKEFQEKRKQYREKHKDYTKEYNKKYREEHKEDKKEYNKEYYENHKNDKEFQEKRKQYREEHKEEINENKKKYYEEHKKEISEYKKKYRKDNPEKFFNHFNNRRLKEENQGNGINREQWFEMMEFFNWTCAYSGEYLGGDNKDRRRTIDHIVPLNNNGEHEIWNCVPMLKSYNSSKHDNNMLSWYLQQEYFDIDRLTKIYEWRIYAYWKWKE